MAKRPKKFQSILERIKRNDPTMTKLNLDVEELTDSDTESLAKALEHNTFITSLRLMSNQIGPKGAIALAQNTSITSLSLQSNKIGDEGAIALSHNSTITHLNLSTNQISDKGAQALARNTTITHLDLSYNQITDEGTTALAQNTSIVSLELRQNKINSKGAIALAGNTTITELDLDHCTIGKNGAQVLAQNTVIVSLKLKFNQIGSEGAEALAKSRSITQLCLSYNHIGNQGARVLAGNTTITSLDLSGNKISTKGAQALASNTSIICLDLSINQIGEQGAKALASNTSITDLNLSENQIGDQGARTLASNASIIYLNLSRNEIGDQGAKALASSSSIIDLNLSKNQIGEQGAKALASNTSIMNLNLSENQIGDQGAKALASNTSITTLWLSSNKIGAQGARAFAKNTSITCLYLHDNKIEDQIGPAFLTNKVICVISVDGKQGVSDAIDRNIAQFNRFLDACQDGDIETMASMIKAGVVSPYGKSNRTSSDPCILHQAIYHNQHPVAAYLVQHFPRLLSYRDWHKVTPLALAETRGDIEMIAILRGKASATAKPPAPSPTGTPLKHEHILLGDKIAEGGFGEVFRGTYQLAPVAIKRLLLKQLSERALREFQEEAKLMATLRHPHIITFYGFTKVTPFYIVMEWMAKGSLFSVLHSDEVLSWPKRIQWGLEISLGLHYLHAFTPQILHRDLKSLNVLIGERDEAKLTDFGLAMANIRTTTKTLTSKSPSKQAPEAVGSLRWMAPEILGLKAKYTPGSDVFALAMVLWELASREIPYAAAPAESIIRDAVKGGEREDIPDGCPPELATIIQIAWDQEAAKRPSAEEVVKHLQAIQGKSSGSQPAGSPPYSAAATISQSRGYAMHTEGAPAPDSGADAASAGYQMGSQ